MRHRSCTSFSHRSSFPSTSLQVETANTQRLDERGLIINASTAVTPIDSLKPIFVSDEQLTPHARKQPARTSSLHVVNRRSRLKPGSSLHACLFCAVSLCLLLGLSSSADLQSVSFHQANRLPHSQRTARVLPSS